MVFGRRYRVTEKIGAGGMAEVYKAVDEVLGRTVAVKVLHPRYAADPTFAARFRQEAQAAANLQSPYIVNIYDWGQDGDTYYIVMELMRGTDLKTIIQQKGALPSVQVAELGAQVCAALSVAHGYDVIHRDIKPHNIMVGPDGSVKVMDFGIARAGNTTMTQTGSVLGTAHYVSPEQAQGRPLTAASDLYSLGIVLYEAAVGRLPFDADTPVSVALKQVNEQPPAPREANPNVDAGLETVILKAMAKSPADRYETSDEMRRDLLRVAQGREVTAVAPVPGHVAATPAAAETAVMPAVGASGGDRGMAPVMRTAPRRGPVWPWVFLGVLLIAGGLAAAYFMGLLGPQGVQVPDVTGKKLAVAESLIADVGFLMGDPTQEYSNDVDEGLIISQSPDAGTIAEKGSTIDVVVSRGPKLTEVPNLVGLTEAEARDALSNAGLTPAPLDDQYSAEFEAGIVFQQKPDPMESVPEGSAVQYVVSRGKKIVSVPNVRGMQRAEAEATLREAGFKPTTREQFDEKIAAGKVISQNPAAGLEVAEGSSVTITVSKGPDRVAVPDVIGMIAQEARVALEKAGLVPDVTYEPHANSGTVIDQNPEPETMVKRGTSVTIVIDAPPP